MAHLIRFLLFWAMLLQNLFALSGCGKNDRQLVDDLRTQFQAKRFREVVSDYQRIGPRLTDNEQAASAQTMYNQAVATVRKSMAFIAEGDSAAKYGFAKEACERYEQAATLEPAETTITIKLKLIPRDARPVYRFAGRIRDWEFEHTYHTKWVDDILAPDYVEVTVINNSTTKPVDLARFVPSLYYLEVTRTGAHAFVVVADPDKYLYTKLFSDPIWRGETKTGTVRYGSARVTQQDPNLSFSEIFRRIIRGNDRACYVNMVGFQNSEIRGLDFIRYE